MCICFEKQIILFWFFLGFAGKFWWTVEIGLRRALLLFRLHVCFNFKDIYCIGIQDDWLRASIDISMIWSEYIFYTNARPNKIRSWNPNLEHILYDLDNRGDLLRAVPWLTLRWKLQILSYFYSFQSFQSIFGLYMMKQYVVKLRKLFPQFYTGFCVFDVTPW